jgi:hypothetical protein
MTNHTLTFSDIPLSVYNRALEIYGQPPETEKRHAITALLSAEGRIDITPDYPGITAFAQAVAEHMSSGEGYRLA